MKSMLCAAVGLVLTAAPASAADLLVDASGSGAFTTIQQAMLVAQPGDRILVLPGSYPPFHFARGVSVIGMGDDPGDVLIGRCDLHVTVPVTGYDAKLVNVMLGDGAPENVLALSGNESPPGTFTTSGVRIQGGVFLGGGADGFHVHLQNTSVSAGPGQGFLGAAVHLGGTPGFSAELVGVDIQAWDATPSLAAGIGLRLAGGMRARLVASEVRGGSGSGHAPSAGAAALVSWTPLGPVDLRVDGNTLVQGGSGASGGAGGAGIALSGSLELGTAQVLGGDGAPAGPAFSGVTPVALAAAGYLELVPQPSGAAQSSALWTGDEVHLQVATPGDLAAIVVSIDIGAPPSATEVVPIGAPLFVVFDNALSAFVPPGGGSVDMPGVFAYAQAFSRPLGGGPWVASNVQALELHLLPFAP